MVGVSLKVNPVNCHPAEYMNAMIAHAKAHGAVYYPTNIPIVTPGLASILFVVKTSARSASVLQADIVTVRAEKREFCPFDYAKYCLPIDTVNKKTWILCTNFRMPSVEFLNSIYMRENSTIFCVPYMNYLKSNLRASKVLWSDRKADSFTIPGVNVSW